MLTENRASKEVGELATAVRETARPRDRLRQYTVGVASFAAVVIQFGLIVLVLSYWQLESLALVRLMQLAFVGFVIHHLLPLRFRLPFFAVLSMVAVLAGVGHFGPNVFAGWLSGKMTTGNFLYHLLPGVTLIAIGLGLIGICHLPIGFWKRVGLVGLVAAILTILRANSRLFPDVAEMWVILGSMFMFRLIIYLYDLKHRTAPFSAARAISYFFLLPNVCFPLFPVVDYKTFCGTYYNEDWPRIYQTGLRWMARGVFQLLLYRIVYQFAPLDVYKLSSPLDAAGCILGMYLLYLRVSGTFHLITGLLHMFGFNLPETHHLYLLASSFTDFWRRINIYWKDFVMKLFFYPTHFKLRKLGMLSALSIATMVTFLATWVLHSWQWFWIRGKPLLNLKDFCFWMILAVLVLVTAIYETTRTRKKSLTPSRLTLRRRLMIGLQAGAVFCAMAFLWAFWSCQSWGEFQTLLDAASHPSLRDIAVVLGVLAVICLCGTFWGQSFRDTSEGKQTSRQPFHFWRSALVVTTGTACLLAVPSAAIRMNPSVRNVIGRLHGDVLNARDLATQRRGYYEELDVGRTDNWQWQVNEDPEGWREGDKVIFRARNDFLLREIVPSVSTVLGGAPISSNHLGMRDREYEKIKPANTYRILLLGASNDMGFGVKDDQTYENVAEDLLNKQPPDPHFAHYEILNLSVAAYSVLQRLERFEQDGFALQPDAAIFSVAAADTQFLPAHLRKALIAGIQPPPEYRDIVEQVIRKAHVNGKMPPAMIERRLQPYVGEVCEWAFRRFAQLCAQHGVRPIVIYRPAPVDFTGSESTIRAELISAAHAAGLEVIDLSSAFDSVTNRNTLMLGKWDDHTTPLGHRLLAEKLYEDLVPLLKRPSTISSSAVNPAERK